MLKYSRLVRGNGFRILKGEVSNSWYLKKTIFDLFLMSGLRPVMFGRLPSEGIEENQIEILIENQKQRKQGILSTKNHGVC